MAERHYNCSYVPILANYRVVCGINDMSISIATNGKFAGPPARTAIFTRSGGDAGGGYYEKPKPIVRINRVRYKNKQINIEVKHNDREQTGEVSQ